MFVISCLLFQLYFPHFETKVMRQYKHSGILIFSVYIRDIFILVLLVIFIRICVLIYKVKKEKNSILNFTLCIEYSKFIHLWIRSLYRLLLIVLNDNVLKQICPLLFSFSSLSTVTFLWSSNANNLCKTMMIFLYLAIVFILEVAFLSS